MDLSQLLPILRSDADPMKELAPHWPVVPGVAVFLANVSRLETGNLGVSYLLKSKLASLPPPAELLAAAHANLKVGLRVERKEVDRGSFFEVTRPGTFGASVVTLPDFYDNASSWTGSTAVFVCILTPDVAVVTDRGNPIIPQLRTLAAQSVAATQAVNLSGITYWLGPGGATPDSEGGAAAPADRKPWWKVW